MINNNAELLASPGESRVHSKELVLIKHAPATPRLGEVGKLEKGRRGKSEGGKGEQPRGRRADMAASNGWQGLQRRAAVSSCPTSIVRWTNTSGGGKPLRTAPGAASAFHLTQIRVQKAAGATTSSPLSEQKKKRKEAWRKKQ